MMYKNVLKDSRLVQGGFERDICGLGYNYSGPQGQFVYIFKFPVSYKNIQLINQTVGFTNYFDWMGQIREFSLRPIMKKLLKLVRPGDWGLVTNVVNLNIDGFVKADEVLEGRMWLSEVSGRGNIFHLSFNWQKRSANGSLSRVASSVLVFSCVKIINNVAMITKPPSFLKKFLDEMGPRGSQKKKLLGFSKAETFNYGTEIKTYQKRARLLLWRGIRHRLRIQI